METQQPGVEQVLEEIDEILRDFDVKLKDLDIRESND